MRITLKNSQRLSINSKSDLNLLIPDGVNGAAINYGQGEGQFEINGSVWGIYADRDGLYNLVFEEGELDFNEFISTAQSVIDKVCLLTGDPIYTTVSGSFQNEIEI